MKNIYTREEVVEILKECDLALYQYRQLSKTYSEACSIYGHENPRWSDGYPMHPPSYPKFSDGSVAHQYEKIREVFKE